MRLILLLSLCVLLMGTGRVQAQETSSDPQVVNAVDGLLAAFQTHSIVAIGEQHGIRELGDLYQELLRDPRFAEIVDAVVLEYGNARYQDLIDRYMNGEDVPFEELRQVWSDAIAKIPGGTEVMYLQLFTTLRAINQTLPEGERIRVLLGDPPVDWSAIETREDALPYQLSRESHFAEVVIREVLDQGLKALVIIGGPHLDRSPMTALPPMPSDMTPPSNDGAVMIPSQVGVMQQIVEQAYPGQTFVAIVHTGFAEDACNAEVEARMAGWENPAMAYVEGSWIESIACTKFPAPIFINPSDAGAGNQLQGAPSGQPMNNPAAPMALPERESLIAQADGYLYFGNRDDLTMSPFDPSIYLDMAYFEEMSRRHEIMLGQPLDWKAVAQDNPRRYVDNFPKQ